MSRTHPLWNAIESLMKLAFFKCHTVEINRVRL